jgi:hypothetical protein
VQQAYGRQRDGPSEPGDEDKFEPVTDLLKHANFRNPKNSK